MTLPVPRIWWPFEDLAEVAVSFESGDDFAAAWEGVLSFNVCSTAAERETPEAIAESIQDGFISVGASFAQVGVTASGHVEINWPVLDHDYGWITFGVEGSLLDLFWTSLGFQPNYIDGSTRRFYTAVTVIDGVPTAHFVSQNQMKNIWIPEFPPRIDYRDKPAYSRARTDSGAGAKTTTSGHQWRRKVIFEWIPAHKTFTAAEGDTYLNEALQRLFDTDGHARFLYSPDSSDPLSDPTIKANNVGERLAQWYALSGDITTSFDPTEMEETNLEYWRIELELVRPRPLLSSV